MKGQNKIEMNHETMRVAVEYYLRTVVFNCAIEVTSISKADSYGNTFEVCLKEPEVSSENPKVEKQ